LADASFALLFPGQGAQTVGMAGAWCVECPPALAIFERASAVLGYDLLGVCQNGPAERLNTTAISQPAILVTSLAMLELLRTLDDSPFVAGASEAFTAGLSLGEYTALVHAGGLDLESAVKVVDVRGRAMQACAEASPGGMVAILGLDREQVEAVCDEARGEDVLAVANVLCPGNIVVSGSRDACERVPAVATAAGAMKCVSLEVAGAFHTPLMEPAREKLAAVLDEVDLRTPRIPVISNVDAQPHTNPAEIRALLARQVCGVVEWQASMEHLLSTGVGKLWEVGPGRVLRGLLKRIDRKRPCQGVIDG
jgi:[acyl-carrier-protein] S-malonyltransferase